MRVKRFRVGYTQLAQVLVRGSLSSWKKYLDVAYPVKPADWGGELARIEAKLSEPGRMQALQAMCKAKPGDAGAQLPNVACPVLVVEGSLDPDMVAEKFGFSSGDAFLNAATEFSEDRHPVRSVVLRHREWLTGFLAELLQDLGHRMPGDAADDIRIGLQVCSKLASLRRSQFRPRRHRATCAGRAAALR